MSTRTKQSLIAAIPAAALALAVYSLLAPPWEPGLGPLPEPEPTSVRSVPVEVAGPGVALSAALERLRGAQNLRIERTSLGRGGTLTSALDDLAVPGELREALLRAASVHLDLRRLPRETGVAAGFDADGRLRSVSLRSETERFLRLTVDRSAADDPIRGEWIVLPEEREVRIVEGVVESSVARAFDVSSSHGPLLTVAFADIFQWDVDLFVDPRVGDRFRVIYEHRVLGDPPPDLPPFARKVELPGAELPPGPILAARYSGRMARATAFRVENDLGVGDYYDHEGKPLRKHFLKSPLNYRRVSSGFSHARRNPVTRKVVPHHGVDFAADAGTPVVATADGRILSAGWSGALGRAVRIRHGSEYVTVYGHLRRLARGVRRGAEVKQNQVIGYVGSSGRATGPHLHYAVMRNGQPVNPLRFENPPAEPLAPELMPRLEIARRRWMPLLDVIPPEGVELAAGGEPSCGAAGPG